ncbi:MAG: response regulator transcription factor [bacterium]
MKILLVEDETKLAQSIKNGLKQEGHVVDILSDGELAETRILMNKDSYEMILLDLNIPGKDGISVCKTLRSKDIKTPILMLTARDTKTDIVTGLDAGADDYLIKPFAFEELLARIRAISRRSEKIFIEVLQTKDLVLNPQTREVMLRGKKVALTQKEFNILEFLMKKPGIVVSRESILENIWDFSYDSFSNVVDVHVKNLRKKINKYDQLLETVRGVGYKIKA